MGYLFLETLPGPKVYKCKCCKVDLTTWDDIISKNFQGRHGKAYLVDRVVNISVGPNEDRHLTTGLHTTNAIYCSNCQQLLGWRYEKAYDEAQKYKEGKYALEVARMSKARDADLPRVEESPS